MPTLDYLQPDGLGDSRPMGFTQVVAARGGKHVFVSGQVAVGDDGKPVAIGDIHGQTVQVLKNLEKALAAASATFDDVVKLTIYVVDFKPEDRLAILEARKQFISSERAPASTLIGVQALVAEPFLIEIEATAVVD